MRASRLVRPDPAEGPIALQRAAGHPGAQAALGVSQRGQDSQGRRRRRSG
jgi:hypothetical protein